MQDIGEMDGVLRTERVNYRLTPDERDLITELARRLGTNESDAIRVAVKRMVESLRSLERQKAAMLH